MSITPKHNPEHDDTQFLAAVVTRLRAELAAARLESANRLAAIRAALGAARDGEADPLAYLCDEYPDYRERGVAIDEP